MKSETYTPVYSEEVAEEYSVHYNPAVHGTSGPVQVSYPTLSIPSLIGPFGSFDNALQLALLVNLFAGMNLLGLPIQFDTPTMELLQACICAYRPRPKQSGPL
ncbi:hypothetical protein ABVK25_001091 [Lepraria finkii]|uniref:Uncharacterized protein n=1 Tax=Lepraria finkii TaxID=1340010 RepID=A0ABR4BKM4_9LECA